MATDSLFLKGKPAVPASIANIGPSLIGIIGSKEGIALEKIIFLRFAGGVCTGGAKGAA